MAMDEPKSGGIFFLTAWLKIEEEVPAECCVSILVTLSCVEFVVEEGAPG